MICWFSSCSILRKFAHNKPLNIFLFYLLCFLWAPFIHSVNKYLLRAYQVPGIVPDKNPYLNVRKLLSTKSFYVLLLTFKQLIHLGLIVRGVRWRKTSGDLGRVGTVKEDFQVFKNVLSNALIYECNYKAALSVYWNTAGLGPFPFLRVTLQRSDLLSLVWTPYI